MPLTPIPELGDRILIVLREMGAGSPAEVIDAVGRLGGFTPTAEDLRIDERTKLPRWQARIYGARRYLGDEGWVRATRNRWRITEEGRAAADEARKRWPESETPPVTRNPDERNLVQYSVIAQPLLDPEIRARVLKQPTDDDSPLPVVIELNLGYPEGVAGANAALAELVGRLGERPGVAAPPKPLFDEYACADLSMRQVRELVRIDHENRRNPRTTHVIHRIWPNFPVEPLIDLSARTVKADAARRSFDAAGRDICWAVVDSGIDRHHPHYVAEKTLEADDVKYLHRDFTKSFAPGIETVDSALQDELGHGTHVAGIIAGHLPDAYPREKMKVVVRQHTEPGDAHPLCEERSVDPGLVSGMSPLTHLVSLKVLDSEGSSDMVAVMAALRYVRETNGDNDKLMKIHGVNLSLGYEFDAEWFACGQSPLCKEVDRLVRSGVVVVVAAGNTGYGRFSSKERQTNVGLTMTINDPGNAERAITVGATHRDSPHTYGVSYFSSKGPTGDGRLKPDLIAPGERITSCATGRTAARWGLTDVAPDLACYVTDTGTSFAAPHVSGVIAAFLSVRREYICRPDEVKNIFMKSATSLGRERYFEGAGLVDLMRALQSI
ncbi:S8 family serine peptidase [Nocardia sp. NPDC003482]